nr:hypothetical protein [Tanacetum cinerariifolium]
MHLRRLGSQKDVPGADAGGQGEGQAGPDPGAQDEGQTGSNPNEQAEGQAGLDPGNAKASQPMPSPVVHAGLDREYMDLDVADVSTQPLPKQMDEGFTAMAYPKRALEESLKSMYDVPRGPLPPVVIREPESEKYQPLPQVPRKGKEKVVKLVKFLVYLVSSHRWLELSSQPTSREVDRTKHHGSKMGLHEKEDKCQDEGQQHTGDMRWSNREWEGESDDSVSRGVRVKRRGLLPLSLK